MPQLSSETHAVKPQAAQSALDAAHADFTARNPSSLKAYEESCANLPGGNTRTVLHASPFPLTFSSASGCHLTSLDGDIYTDFLGEYTAGIYGHNHPTIRAAIDRALDQGWSFGGNNVHEKQLAKIVCERFSPTMELVRFCNSGTEANMMAVAAAIAWTGRKKVLVFEKGYHGATLSFRAPPVVKAHEAKSVNLPHEWVVAPYNDIKETEKALAALPNNSLAAILVEPMLGSGGGIPGSRDFLQFLSKYASEHGALLIFDEVMTSRLGYRGLGHEIGIRPDLMTLGKWVGGGMSFGAFGGRKDIMGMFDPRNGQLAHAGTFNNNVVSMAAGVAGCTILDEEKTEQMNALGEQMQEMVQKVIDETLGKQKIGLLEQAAGTDPANGALEMPAQLSRDNLSNGHDHHSEKGTLASSSAPRMWISGLGSILVIHFASSPIQSALQSLFYHHMLAHNIYLAERGFIALSIEINFEHVEAFIGVLKSFIEGYKEMI